MDSITRDPFQFDPEAAMEVAAGFRQVSDVIAYTTQLSG
jgi:hypothetical protein